MLLNNKSVVYLPFFFLHLENHFKSFKIMLQSMMIQLAGFQPLQNKILMYCLGSPSASVMKPLCVQVEAKRQKKGVTEDEATAWRYKKSGKNNNAYGRYKRPNTFGSFLGLCVIEELRMIKEEDPILKAEGDRQVKRLLQTLIEIKQFELRFKEEMEHQEI
jgi:hypothetical protein